MRARGHLRDDEALAEIGLIELLEDLLADDRLVGAVTSPADGLRGKPHPDIFEAAALRLGVAAASCLVFEDAPLGIEAARRAGMDAIALTTTLPPAAFAAYPNLRHTMADFVGFDLRQVTTLSPEENRHA